MAEDTDHEPEADPAPPSRLDGVATNLAKTVHGLLDNLPNRIATALSGQLGHLPVTQVNATVAAADAAVRAEVAKARAEIDGLLS